MSTWLKDMDSVDAAMEDVYTENEMDTMEVIEMGMEGISVYTEDMDVDVDMGNDLMGMDMDAGMVDMAANTGDGSVAMVGFQTFFQFQ